MAPSPRPGVAILDAETLAAWQDFYLGTQGWNWKNCASSLRDPCNATAAGCRSADYAKWHISCGFVDGRYTITDIYMMDANMRGVVPDSIAKLGLRVFAVGTTPAATRDTANVFFNPTCVEIPRCASGKAVCVTTNSGVSVCPPPAPTPAPVPPTPSFRPLLP